MKEHLISTGPYQGKFPGSLKTEVVFKCLLWCCFRMIRGPRKPSKREAFVMQKLFIDERLSHKAAVVSYIG